MAFWSEHQPEQYRGQLVLLRAGQQHDSDRFVFDFSLTTLDAIRQDVESARRQRKNGSTAQGYRSGGRRVAAAAPHPSRAPTSPIYLFGVLFPLYFFELFLLQADLAVGFILFWATDVGQVAADIRENVVGLPILLNHGHFVGRKALELLLLRRSLWNVRPQSPRQRASFLCSGCWRSPRPGRVGRLWEGLF